MEITSDRDQHAVVIRRPTLNIGFCNRQQASTTHEVNFKMGRMFSWKAIISFRRESNAVVMHGRWRRHETLGVARTAGCRPDPTTTCSLQMTHHIHRRLWHGVCDGGCVTTSWRSWCPASLTERSVAVVLVVLLRQGDMEVEGLSCWLHCPLLDSDCIVPLLTGRRPAIIRSSTVATRFDLTAVLHSQPLHSQQWLATKLLSYSSATH